MHRIAFVALLLLAAPVRADEPGRCPAPVIAGVSKAFPKVTISACKPERDHGKDIFEVKLTRSGGDRLEVDVAADGTILQVEEPIAVDALPDAVRKAFATKYPRAKATGANKQTAGKDVRYEIAFVVDKARKEATFSADGAFVEEE
jgi:hypothetical protein